MGSHSRTRLSNFTLFFLLSCIGEGNGTHSRILVWRISGTGEPGGLLSMGSHRVGHDRRDLAAAAAFVKLCMNVGPIAIKKLSKHEYAFQLNWQILDPELNIDSVFQQTISRRLRVPVCLGKSDDRRFCRNVSLCWAHFDPGTKRCPCRAAEHSSCLENRLKSTAVRLRERQRARALRLPQSQLGYLLVFANWSLLNT